MNRREALTSMGILTLGIDSKNGMAAGPASATQSAEPLQADDLYTVDYQRRDDEIINYGFYELEYLPRMKFRGPALDLEGIGSYITCIGAAQTLGTYVGNPFPQLLSQKYGLPVWNLGVGGADPGYFLSHPELFRHINKSKFVVLQVMAARNSANDRMEKTKFPGLCLDKKVGDYIIASDIWQRVLKEEPQNFDVYMAQSQQSWERDLTQLISKISVPVLHFWFSPKALDQAIDISKKSVTNMVDEYPQFVTGKNLEPIRKANQPFAECHSSRNMVFPLTSKYTGKPVKIDYSTISDLIKLSWVETHNKYYPSPEMHWDAVEVLGKAIDQHRLLG